MPQTRAALTELTRTRMLAESSVGRFALRDLLRVYAGELVREQEMPSARTAALLRVYDHYLDAARTGAPSPCRVPAGPDPPSTAKTVPERPAGTQGTLRWFAAEEQVLHALLRQAARDGFHHHACRLAWWLQGYLDADGRSADAVAVLGVALDAARAAGDARRGCTGRSRAAWAGPEGAGRVSTISTGRPTCWSTWTTTWSTRGCTCRSGRCCTPQGVTAPRSTGASRHCTWRGSTVTW